MGLFIFFKMKKGDRTRPINQAVYMGFDMLTGKYKTGNIYMGLFIFFLI